MRQNELLALIEEHGAVDDVRYHGKEQFCCPFCNAKYLDDEMRVRVRCPYCQGSGEQARALGIALLNYVERIQNNPKLTDEKKLETLLNLHRITDASFYSLEIARRCAALRDKIHQDKKV